MNKKLMVLLVVPALSYSFSYPQGIEIVPNKEFSSFKGSSHTEYAKKLLNIEVKNNYSRKFYNDPNDTHMKKDLYPIKLNFKFDGIKSIDQKSVIGFAPMGQYKNGWTGITEYFKDKELGVCTYSINPIIYVRISDAIASHEINDKITSIKVKGNNNDGYLYTVNWYEDKGPDNVIDSEIECANMLYDENILKNIIALARKVDKE